MLSREENELLTRVAPGTPMGTLLRRYWLPALLAEELPSPDCPPVRVTLLGEPLVAFRDSAGRVALLGAHCPHRGASLFFGRNEGGLRCVYHGWKFDVTGACVDMPNEPPESSFKSKIRHTAYPCLERGDIIWVYMGPPEQTPELPQMEWMLVPPEQRYVHKRYQASSYLQNVEGEVDSSHVSFLHRSLRTDGGGVTTISGQRLLSQARHYAPTFEVRETDYGLLIGARRDWDDEQYYWRLTQFLMPVYTMIPSEPGSPISYTAGVPIDDTQTWGYTVTWRPDQPLLREDVARIESWTGIYAEVDPKSYLPVCSEANDYLIDRAVQRTDSFTGIRGIREQDLAVQEDQFGGPIADRTREHLGSSDTAVIAMRRMLLRSLADLEQGVEPYSAQHGEVYRVRSAAFLAERRIPLDELPVSLAATE